MTAVRGASADSDAAVWGETQTMLEQHDLLHFKDEHDYRSDWAAALSNHTATLSDVVRRSDWDDQLKIMPGVSMNESFLDLRLLPLDQKRRGRSGLIASGALRSCCLVTDELDGILAE